MSIDSNKLINVLNYNYNPVAIKTHMKEYICSPAQGEDSPSISHLTFSEIESLNSNTNAFKIGILRFPKEIEKQMYEELRIVDWESILTNKAIEDIILHPTPEGLAKLIEIQNASLFERVRGIFYSLKNSNAYDISNRVEAIVTARYRELANKQVKSKIEINKKMTASDSVVNEKVNELEQKNEEMKLQMEAMQKMMEQMLQMQSANVQKTTETKSEDTKKTVKSSQKTANKSIK